MNKRIGLSLLCVAVAAGAVGDACGQYTVESVTSFPLVAPTPIVVFSNSSLRLPGRGGLVTDPDAALVEIRALKFGSSSIPPEPGNDSDKDPVILTTCIGAGIMEDNPGRFVAVLPPEAFTNYVAVGGKSYNYRGFFARVYNTPTAEDATYYVNSNLVGYDPSIYYTNLTFATAMKAIEGRSDDTDGDGIPDVDEIDYGTNPYKGDTDGDGIDDFEEIYFGLDPLADSHPTIQALTTNRDKPAINAVLPDDSEWHVEWQASTNPRVKYVVEFVDNVTDWSTTNAPKEEFSYPTQADWAHDVSRWITNGPRGFFRLRLELDRSELDVEPEEEPEPDGE